MALFLKIDFFCQRSEVSLTLDPQASLLTVLPMVPKAAQQKKPYIPVACLSVIAFYALLMCKSSHRLRMCLSLSCLILSALNNYTEAKVDVTQEIEQRAQQAAQAGADHCALCSTGCLTVSVPTLFAYNSVIC